MNRHTSECLCVGEMDGPSAAMKRIRSEWLSDVADGIYDESNVASVSVKYTSAVASEPRQVL